MRQIICLSTSNFFPHPTRKQQVMRRLPDAEILYFDPAITYLAPIKDRSLASRLRAWKNPPVNPQENITVYATKPVIPFYNKKRKVNAVNQWFLSRYVKKQMKKHGFEKPILWLYHPSSIDAVKRIPHSALVYDCVDNHAVYPGQIDQTVVYGMEAELCKKADVIFVTSAGLKRRIGPFNPETYLIPNGADYELFSKAGDSSFPRPEDLKDIKSPIFGFVGALQDCIDYSLVEYAAKNRPEWSFVFVGPPLPGVNLKPLKELDNVHLLGPKPHEEIVSYLAHFDVLLNLFKKNELSKDVSPLKFYEYLATGKPIVSTPEPAQVRDFSDAIYIAPGGDDFIARCEEALLEDGSLREKRQAYGRASSWDARVKLITGKLEALGIF